MLAGLFSKQTAVSASGAVNMHELWRLHDAQADRYRPTATSRQAAVDPPQERLSQLRRQTGSGCDSRGADCPHSSLPGGIDDSTLRVASRPVSQSHHSRSSGDSRILSRLAVCCVGRGSSEAKAAPPPLGCLLTVISDVASFAWRSSLDSPSRVRLSCNSAVQNAMNRCRHDIHDVNYAPSDC